METKSLTGTNSIFISGVTHGIGKATAEFFLEKGWTVYGCASNPNDDRGRLMQGRFSNFHFFLVDISDEQQVKTMFEKIPHLDVAFNNAGIGTTPLPIHQMDTKAAHRILDVNLMGTAICLKYEVDKMLSNKSIIINNASVSAFQTGTGCEPIYAASKAGIVSLTKEVANDDLYKDKIKFYSICPAYIKTRMTAVSQQENESVWQEALFVAQKVYHIIQNSQDYKSGKNFFINAGENE